MTTLYEENTLACDDLERRGYKGIAAMTKHFHRSSEMSRALGFAPDGSAVSKWLRGLNNPEWKTEAKAANWLLTNTPSREPFAAPLSEVAEPATVSPSPILMVVCPLGQTPRVRKILAMLGCEVEDL